MADPQVDEDDTVHKDAENSAAAPLKEKPKKPVELNGPKGLEPTRYGDWEKNGRCTDF